MFCLGDRTFFLSLITAKILCHKSWKGLSPPPPPDINVVGLLFGVELVWNRSSNDTTLPLRGGGYLWSQRSPFVTNILSVIVDVQEKTLFPNSVSYSFFRFVSDCLWILPKISWIVRLPAKRSEKIHWSELHFTCKYPFRNHIATWLSLIMSLPFQE